MIECDMDDVIDALEREIKEEEEEEASLEPLQESLETVDAHEGSVFCIDSHKALLATGGEDDLGKVWSYNASRKKLELLLTTEKFKDSVTNVKFSADGKYAAIADMAGLIRVYTLETRELFWSHDTESDLEMIDWHPGCNVLFCSTAEGYFYMLKISTNEIKLMYAGDSESLSNFKILKDGKRAVCCYNNGCVRVWDLKTTQCVHSYANAHEKDILSVDVSVEGNLIATAGLDMKIHLVNTINGKFVGNLVVEDKKARPARDEDEVDDMGDEEVENSIESVAFSKNPNLPLLACATLNGAVLVWDLNTQSVRSRFQNESGVGYTKLAWNAHGTLYASTVDGVFQIFDGRNMNLQKRIKCHHSEILDFCFNENATVLYTAGNDNTVKLFDLNTQS
jgi:WD40 repeat protein